MILDEKIYKAVADLIVSISVTENVATDIVIDKVKTFINNDIPLTNVQAYMKMLGPTMSRKPLTVSEIDSTTTQILKVFSKTDIDYLLTHITPYGFNIPAITDTAGDELSNDIFCKNLVVFTKYIVQKQKLREEECP
jgi:hypothetical protein